MNAQENYEQLKRRNRRRLVGALIMVVIAAILLVIMLSRRTPQPVSAPQLDVRTASSANAASGTTAMASQVSVTAQVQSASAIVLEPVHGTTASAGSTPINSDHASERTEHQPVSRPAVNTDIPAKPSDIPVKTPGAVQTGTQQNNTDSVHTRPSLQSSRTPAENKVINKEAAESKKIEKNTPVPVSTATGSHSKTDAVVAKPANKTPTSVKPAAPAKPANNPTGGKLTPQQILENKAAGTMSKNSASGQNRSSATSSSNKPPVERTVIQIGAYTTEAQASLVQQRLAAVGVTTSISSRQTSKGTLYRVRSQVYNNRSQALQNLDKVHAAGLDGLVIGL